MFREHISGLVEHHVNAVWVDAVYNVHMVVWINWNCRVCRRGSNFKRCSFKRNLPCGGQSLQQDLHLLKYHTLTVLHPVLPSSGYKEGHRLNLFRGNCRGYHQFNLKIQHSEHHWVHMKVQPSEQLRHPCQDRSTHPALYQSVAAQQHPTQKEGKNTGIYKV